jgi:thioredoxin reductase
MLSAPKETVMPDVIVIGDGPGGLSAALFLAKNQLAVVVFGQDKTAMNYALVRNYLGLPEITGTEFQRVARRQVAELGAQLRGDHVESIASSGDGWTVTLEGGEKQTARFLVLSEGKGPRLAKQLGLAFDEVSGIATDRNARSNLDGVYIVGRSARPGRSQAIISAGDGAAAAIDILSRIKGENFVDWDEPPKA